MAPVPYAKATANFISGSLRGTFVAAQDVQPQPQGGIRGGSTADPRAIQLYDGRSAPCRGLTRGGFDLIAAGTAVADFGDGRAVTSTFYEECAAMVKVATGCRSAHVITHLRRNGEMPTVFNGGGVYASVVHADFTPFVHGMFGRNRPDLEALVAGKQYAIYNLWRSTDLHGDVEATPLAVCDSTTVSAADIAHTEVPAAHTPYRKITNIYRLAYNADQRWYVFPRMSPRETLIFKQYDTREAVASRRACFHTAVDDPRSPPNPRRRESIEVRVVAIFGDDGDAAARGARYRAEIPGGVSALSLYGAAAPPPGARL